MKLSKTVFTLSVVILCAGPARLLSGTPGPYTVGTDFLVLVGYPSSGQTSDSAPFIVPGAVIPLDAETIGMGKAGALEKTLAQARVVEKLWATFRLDPARRVQKSASGALAMGKLFELPRIEDASIAITAMLVGYSEKLATYRIMFKQGVKTLADSTINVNFGERAVVGGMDGDSAPYLFVVVEPGLPDIAPSPDITHPTIVSQTLPRYPEGARKERVTGVVVLEVGIDENGRLTDVQVLESPDARLTESAIASVKQWVFRPAKKADGTPVAVRTTFSIIFRLK